MPKKDKDIELDIDTSYLDEPIVIEKPKSKGKQYQGLKKVIEDKGYDIQAFANADSVKRKEIIGNLEEYNELRAKYQWPHDEPFNPDE